MVRRLAAGFLAGVSIVAGFFTILLLFFFSAGFWTVLHESASQSYGNIPFSEIFALALGQMLATLPRYFWSGRWAMLALGGLGMLLALVDVLQRRIRRPWRNRLGFVVTAGATVAVSVAFQYANRSNAYALQAAQPAPSGGQSLDLSNAELIGLWGVVGVLLGLAIWYAWSWWYPLWAKWLDVPGRQQGPATLGDDYRWREHQQRMTWLKTGAWDDMPDEIRAPARAPMAKVHWPWLLAGLAGASLLLLPAMRLYTHVQPDVSVGQLRLLPEAPPAIATVWLGPEPRWIKVSRPYGAGTVSVRLDGDHGPVHAPVSELRLSNSEQDTSSVDFTLLGQPPGNYRLQAQLRDGRGGLLTYTALAERGLALQLGAAGVGLAAGLWAAMALVLVLELNVTLNSTQETLPDE